MNPTPVRRSLGGTLALILASCVATAQPFQAQLEPRNGLTSGHQGARMVPESNEGLQGLVQQALVRLRPGRVTIDELFRHLKVTSRIPGSLTRLPAYEQLVAVDPAGRVVAHADGTRSSVANDGELSERLVRVGEDLLLIHNHPEGTGLSDTDLGQLTNPGVSAIIALGHDGSVYAASLGKAFIAFQIAGPPVSVAGFESPGHTTIMTFVISAEREVRRQRARSFAIDEHAFLSHFHHIVSLALDEAGAIRYRSVLAGVRRDSFNRFRDEFGHIIEEARHKVAAGLKRRATTAS